MQPVHVGSRLLCKACNEPNRRGLSFTEKQRGLRVFYTLLKVADEKRTYILLLFFISCFYVLYMSINVYSFDKLVWTVSAVFCL